MTVSEREALNLRIAKMISSLTDEQYEEFLFRLVSEVNMNPEIKYNNLEAPHMRSWEHFLSVALLRFEVTAQPLLKALYSKAPVHCYTSSLEYSIHLILWFVNIFLQ